MEDLLIKAATLIAVAVAALSSFPSPAQPQPQAQTVQQNPSSTASPSSPAQVPGPSTNAQNGAQTQQDPANSNAPAMRLAPVRGELVSNLDSKSARQGDSVVVKTEESVKTASGTEIPKGSKLVGRVTNVQAVGDGKQNSQIAIQFDHAELNGGQNLPIESVIQSVSPASGDAMNNNAPAGAPTGYGAGGSSGAMGGTPAANTNQNSENNRSGSVNSTTGQAGATDQSNGVPPPGSVVARTGNIAIRTTAIPGILVANDINGLPFSNASGLLVGARRDIKLDGGTQMILAVAEAPQGTGSGMNR